MVSLILILLVSIISAMAPGTGQLMEAAGLEEGTFVFSYPTREGVEGNDNALRFRTAGDRNGKMYFCGTYAHRDEYRPGDVAARCRVRDGEVVAVKYSVPGNTPNRSMVESDLDLGRVPAKLAVAFFLGLVRGKNEEAAEDAVLGPALAEETDIATPFIELVRDEGLEDGPREEALFWLAILAGEKALEPIQRMIDDDDEDLELRRHAVFTLSRLEQETAYPLLMEVARNHPNPEIQRSAFIWLAEYNRPEVVNFFEEILVGP